MFNMFSPHLQPSRLAKEYTHPEEPYLLKLDDRCSLRLDTKSGLELGDSSGLQKGLIMFVDNKSLCGEGVGFGMPAVEYSNHTLFSTAANIQATNKTLVKSFSIDASQRKTWKNRVPVDNTAYNAIQRRLANTYRTNKRSRRGLDYMIKIQSLLGVGLSHQRVRSKGFIAVEYHLSDSRIVISVDSSKLFDKNVKRVLLFNEQSAEFNLYEDDFGKLSKENIGVWEEVKSEKASLRNERANLSFMVENIPGTKLYRGRELLKPRLNWAGFCYSIPPHMEHFNYTVQIT
jgi:hypothetical protein